jgi:hypothetical protein
MSTGRARGLFLCAILAALGGCASSAPEPIISAAELDSMIRVEVLPVEPPMNDEIAVAAVQP